MRFGNHRKPQFWYTHCMSQQQFRKRRSPNEVSVGEIFGHVSVIGDPIAGSDGTYFPCMCDCGKPTFIRMGRLTSTPNVSCGHAADRTKHGGAVRKSNATKHGLSQDRLYRIWCGIRYRCYNADGPAYQHYGGRGIVMCDEWYSDYTAFREWALSNGYADDLTIDRVDVNGNYEPDNCRWATRQRQSMNRRNTMQLSLHGETKSLKEWVEDARCVVKYQTAYQRLLNGWDLERALVTPARKSSANVG